MTGEYYSKGVAVRRKPIIQFQESVGGGNQKYVALLVGEDYSRDGGRAWDDGITELPGVWKDLVRLQRRLSRLGFGKILVLGSNHAQGGTQKVQLPPLVEIAQEKGARGSFKLDGPARYDAMLKSASFLGEHLQNHRADNDLPPLFIFYYSGHGFVGNGGVHRLPLEDFPVGHETEQLIRTVADFVGADAEEQGNMGGGSTLVFLDCCQAGKGIGGSKKVVGAQGDELDERLREIIGSNTQGRFFMGASLGDEQAKEGDVGGYFTAALCASLVPERIGSRWPDTEMLTLDHLFQAIEKELTGNKQLIDPKRQTVAQAAVRSANLDKLSWGDYVLFRNPHVKDPLLLKLTIVPGRAVVMAEEGGIDKEIESLSGSFLLKENKGQKRLYQVPEEWRGKKLCIWVEPPEDDLDSFKPSKRVEIQLDESEDLEIRLRLSGITGGTKPKPLDLAQILINKGEKLETEFPFSAFQHYRKAAELLRELRGGVAKRLLPLANEKMDELRPFAARERLDQKIMTAKGLTAKDRHRKANEELEKLAGNLAKLDIVDHDMVQRLEEERTAALDQWNEWAFERRREEAESLLAEGWRLVEDEPGRSWRLAFQAGLLAGGSEEVKELTHRAHHRAVRSLLTTGKVALENLVNEKAQGILLELVESPATRVLAEILAQDYQMEAAGLAQLMGEERERFCNENRDLFPTIVSQPVPWEGREHEERLLKLGVEIPQGVEIVIHNEKDGGAAHYIPAGKCEMGSEDGMKDEKPIHQVYVGEFYLDVFPVTNAQYAQFIRDTGHRLPDFDGVSNIWQGQDPLPEYADHPVVGVSWADADAYCQWAGKRLPTEAEWEKAARGIDQRIYPWGDEDPNVDQAHFRNNETVPVGSKPAGVSPYGIMDMAGNVWEWVGDWYKKDYYIQGPLSDPQGPADGKLRVFRGGSWKMKEKQLRASFRGGCKPENRTDYRGFRCAQSL